MMTTLILFYAFSGFFTAGLLFGTSLAEDYYQIAFIDLVLALALAVVLWPMFLYIWYKEFERQREKQILGNYYSENE